MWMLMGIAIVGLPLMIWGGVLALREKRSEKQKEARQEASQPAATQ